MAQRSASQPTGTQRSFGRNKNKSLIVFLTLLGLVLAIGLTYFISQAMAQSASSRQFNVDVPVAEFAQTLRDDISEMRRLENNFLLNMSNGDLATNLTDFWQPHSALISKSSRNLVVLERAIDLGFEGQLSEATGDSLGNLQTTAAAVNSIVLNLAEQRGLSESSARSAEINQQVIDDQTASIQALVNIDTNLNRIINLAEDDQIAQEATFNRINLIRNVAIVTLIAGALLLIWLTVRTNEQAEAQGEAAFQPATPKTESSAPKANSKNDHAPAPSTRRLTAEQRPFFNHIQNQLLVVFLAMVGLALAIGITSILSQSVARRTSARLINVDTPIAQYALDFKGDISEMRRLEEAYTFDIRAGDLTASTSALLVPWQGLRVDVLRRILILEQAMELGFEGQLADTIRLRQTEIKVANNALGAITQGNKARNELFAQIEERAETINILSVLLSFSNEKQEELRDAAQINDLSLTLISREYLISGELGKLNQYEALVNSQFVDGDPLSALRVESVRDFRTLFALDQEIARQRTTYAGALERVDNTLNNIIDLTLSDQTAQEAELSQTNLIVITVIAALIVATLIPVGIYLMTSGGDTFEQIESLQNTVASVQRGDFTARAELISKDETRIVATEMNEMLATTFSLVENGSEQKQLQESIMQLLEDVSDVADGDMTIRAHSDHRLTIPMAQAFNETVAQLHDLLTAVGFTTNKVNSITRSSTESTTELTSDSESQIGHIIDTTAAVDEMAVSIQHVSRSAARSAEVSLTAQNSAMQGTQAVEKTISGLIRIQSQTERSLGQINRLTEASQNISQSITLIDEISDQTSVLALNASIRALAAGDDGLGFTVVAREIEDLSTQASQAAQRVAKLTGQIQKNAVLATEAMSSTQSKLSENRKVADEAAIQLHSLETVTEKFSGIINEIRMVTHQQAAKSEVVARSMNEIADSTQQTVTGSHGTIKSLEALGVLTDELRSSIALFKLNSAENEHASNESGALTA